MARSFFAFQHISFQVLILCLCQILAFVPIVLSVLLLFKQRDVSWDTQWVQLPFLCSSRGMLLHEVENPAVFVFINVAIAKRQKRIFCNVFFQRVKITVTVTVADFTRPF